MIQLLQKSQIVLNVRFAVKLIFREQDGELCLNADGGGKSCSYNSSPSAIRAASSVSQHQRIVENLLVEGKA